MLVVYINALVTNNIIEWHWKKPLFYISSCETFSHSECTKFTIINIQIYSLQYICNNQSWMFPAAGI